jgi:hypothetical protein
MPIRWSRSCLCELQAQELGRSPESGHFCSPEVGHLAADEFPESAWPVILRKWLIIKALFWIQGLGARQPLLFAFQALHWQYLSAAILRKWRERSTSGRGRTAGQPGRACRDFDPRHGCCSRAG